MKDMTIPSSSQAFRETVAIALKHYKSPAWLGGQSPLAEPYLLAKHLQTDDDSPEARGRVLQRLLKKATGRLTGKHREHSREILEEYYFQGGSEASVCLKLDLRKATFHEHRNLAIDSLAKALPGELQPAIALESPPQLSTDYYGRTLAMKECLTALQNDQIVLITGGGGMGKTALASRLAHEWGVKRVCWFTIRPALNDYLSALLMQLGYFLHQHGASILWQQVIASHGAVDLKMLEIIPGLVRSTLEQVRHSALLLCIDEVDILRPTESGEHVQFITFVQSLRGLMPVLLVGQRAAIQVEHHVSLTGITPDVLAQWLIHRRIKLSQEEQALLYDFTKGVPHLIELFIALHQVDEPLPTVLQKLSTAPSLELLFGRVWRHLKEAEREVLMELAVMQGAAPADAWRHGRIGALRMLMERHIVQGNDYGGVWLLPAYRQFVLDSLPAQKLAELHARAAHLYASRGQYTLAAHHYAQSSQPEYAIQLWSDHDVEEINQGQAYSALRIFRQMLARSLDPLVNQRLTLVCAHLENLTGNAAKAREHLGSISWPTPILSVQADELAGVIANDRREFSVAQGLFRRALTTAEQLVETRIAYIHKGLGWMHMMEKELDQAWQEAQRAEYEVENLKGFIQEEYRAYRLAEKHYLSALKLAQEMNHVQGIAKTSSNLFGVYAILGQFDQALRYWRIADQGYQQVGKLMAVAGCKSHLCFIYNLMGDHQAALQAAQDALDYLAERGVEAAPGLRSTIDQAMAEALLGLGDLDAAARHTQAALDSNDDRVRLDALRTLAEVHLQRGSFDVAMELITNVIVSTQEQNDRYLEAYAWRVAAQIHRTRHQLSDAHHASEKAIGLFMELNLPHEVLKLQGL